MTELSDSRKEINEINGEILRLFLRRLEICADIAEYKSLKGLPVFDAAREKQILDAVSEHSGHDAEYVRRLFSSIMELSREKQEELLGLTGKDPDTLNIVLIGMPGCGKSTIGARISELTGRMLIETDDMVVEKAGMPIPEIFRRYGEERFRDMESEATQQAGRTCGAVIATGGGCVKRAGNYEPLHRNGIIFQLERDLSFLPLEGRPVSQKVPLEQLYAERSPLYASYRDVLVYNNGTVDETAREIISLFGL